MTVSPYTPDADRPSNRGIPESTSGDWPESQKQRGHEVNRGQKVVAPWNDEEAKEDEHFKQYMTQFFKAYNLGEFGAEDNHTERRDSTGAPASPGTKAFPLVNATKTPMIVPNATVAPHQAGKTRDPERSKRAPESTEDLRQWRQLANSNAKRAIKLHAFRQSVWVMRVYLTLGLVSTICSMGLLSIASNTKSPAYTLGVGALAVAAIACLRYLRLIRLNGQSFSPLGRSG